MNIMPILLFVFASYSVQSQEHHILDNPVTGSHLKHKAVSGSIPFDKTYGQLSSKEKRVFTSIYENFSEADEPTYPLKGLQELYSPIYAAHEKLGRRGKLQIIALIDEKGLVETMPVYDSPSKHMTKIASAVLFSTKFKHALCSGVPCKMEFPFFIELKVSY